MCAECGGGMTIRTKVKPGKAYCYYQCANAHGKQAYALDGRVVRACEHMQSVRTELLDDAVWARIATFLADPGSALDDETAGEDPALVRQLDLLQKQVKAAEEARERTLRAYQRAVIDETTFEREMKRLQGESGELRRQLGALEDQRNRRALAAREAHALRCSLVGITDKPEALDFAGRRRVMHLLVERVVIGHDAEGRVTADVQGYIPLDGEEGRGGAGGPDNEPPSPPNTGKSRRGGVSRNGASHDSALERRHP